MDRNRWQRIEELYHSASAQPPELRPDFLAKECPNDSELIREVLELLAHGEKPDAIVDHPAWSGLETVLSTQELEAGTRLGPYQIDRLLGSGGMGTVYRAKDTRLGRTVAIKVLRAGGGSGGAGQRFEREAQAISSLNHPNVCALYDIGTFADSSFLVMECVEGKTLAEVLRPGPLSIEKAVDIAVDIAKGMAAAHAKGIIHRDLKPGNVMVTDIGAKILDFGLAKTIADSIGGSEEKRLADWTVTAKGIILGTPAYMAPEQLLGDNADARSDVFAFGLVLYEMVTGKRPFAANSVPEMAGAALRNMPATPRSSNSRVSPELQRIILKCIQRDANRRYQTVADLERDLKQLAHPGAPAPGKFPRRLFLAVGTSILLLLIAMLGWQFSPWTRSSGIQSLAVLPLDNLSGDASQDYFADGMTEVLIINLGKIGSLRVISRPSVMKYRGSRAQLRDIAHELNVDALIVGSAARADGKVRITMQLYKASEDRQLWAESYEREMRDVLVLQREVAQAITAEISIKLSPRETARFAKTRPVNPDAFDRYLRGLLLYGRHTNIDNREAIAIMEQAVAFDRGFAAGHALLALVYVERLFFFAPEDQKLLEEKAYVAVEKAASLDPDEAMAYLARGRLLWTPGNRFPHQRAIREYRRALALNPNLAEAHAQLALVFNHVGLLEEALAEANKSADLDPIGTLPRVVIGQALLYGGQHDRALNVWSRNPPDAYASVTVSHTAWTLFQLGRKNEAEASVGRFLAKYPRDVNGLGVQAMLHASSGRVNEAEALIRSVADQKGFGHFHHTAYFIACAYALMGNIDAALMWLKEAIDTGFSCYPLFYGDPNLQILRSDPRWGALIGNLKREWEQYRKLSSETAGRSSAAQLTKEPGTGQAPVAMHTWL